MELKCCYMKVVPICCVHLDEDNQQADGGKLWLSWCWGIVNNPTVVAVGFGHLTRLSIDRAATSHFRFWRSFQVLDCVDDATIVIVREINGPTWLDPFLS